MQVPVQIDFQGGEEAIPRLRTRVEQGLQELESRFGRIVAGRVIVRAPSHHHRTGGLYQVGIHLTLPEGRMVNVERTPTKDERLANPDFALADAFKRARRQLQDAAKRMNGQVKQRITQPVGEVVRIDPSGQFGFLRNTEGNTVYFHRHSVLHDGFAKLKPGSRVLFNEEMGNQGLQASTVKPLGKHNLRV